MKAEILKRKPFLTNVITMNAFARLLKIKTDHNAWLLLMEKDILLMLTSKP